MRHLLLAVLLVAAAETAALACSCMAPGEPEESRAFAREAVRNAVAIAEIEVVSDYRPGGPGERVRLRRLLWGEAPPEFELQRREFASSASCDLLLDRGQRKVVILSPGRNGRFVIQSLCSDFLVSDDYLDITLEEARRLRGGAGERG